MFSLVRELNAESHVKQNELRTEMQNFINAVTKNETKTAEIEKLKSQVDSVELRLAKINNIVSADVKFGKGEVAALRMLEARLDETIIELAETRNLR